MKLAFGFILSFSMLLGIGLFNTHSVKNMDPFLAQSKKVLIFKDSAKALKANYLLQKGSLLSLIWNRNCKFEGDLGDSYSINREVFNSKTNQWRSKYQSRRLELKQDMTIGALEKWANSNDCVWGIGDVRKATVGSVENDIDPFTYKQTFLESMNWKALDDIVKSLSLDDSREVVIAVIDTGIDLNQPELKEHLWENQAELNGLPNFDDDGNGYIDDIYGYNFPDEMGSPMHRTIDDHGTHVAGLAAAKTGNEYGGVSIIGNHVKIMALNVFGRSLGTDTVDIDRAIRYAADNGADIINISAGGPGQSETTASAIAYAIQKSSFVVTSAGNRTLDIGEDFWYPASYSRNYLGMVSVSAYDVSNDQICNFSNYSKQVVEIVAPGCDSDSKNQGLFSTRSKARFGYKKGTSMSAPLVSSFVGLMLKLNNNLDHPEKIESFLMQHLPKKNQFEDYVIDGNVLNFNNLHEQDYFKTF